MRVTLDDLKIYSLYDSLPAEFKGLKRGEYFVFYYTPDYENSKLIIHKYNVVLNLNNSIYRGMSEIAKKAGTGDIQVGYLPYQPFETRDGIFYLFLKTFCPTENVSAFYSYAAQSDSAVNFSLSTGSSVDVVDRASFINAVSSFANPNRLNVISNVYDVVDNYVKHHYNRSLYGGLIKKVVQLVSHEGGIMSEENGTLRFMVIGEKALLDNEQREKLNLAKSLIRSLVNPKDVYIQTGWYYNINDGKWRCNVSDYNSFISNNFIIDYPERKSKVYKPAYLTVSDTDFFSLFVNPDMVLTKNYNGKLSDVLNHEVLFKYYPQLANLPLLYRELYNKGDYMFYFAPAGKELGYMNIQGNVSEFNLLSVILHETQHAIQNIEDFATGGNDFLAKFVVSIGGKEVRKIFSSINVFQKFINTSFIDEGSYVALKSAIEKTSVSSPDAISLKKQILTQLETYNTFDINKSKLGFYIIFLIGFNKVYNEGELLYFLEERYGFEIYDLIEMIKDANENMQNVSQKLSSEGYRAEDINRIMFNAYEDLLGEVEARGTQEQMRIPINLSNYFFVHEWEKNPTRQIAVIGGNYITSDTSKIKAAVEKYKEGYVLHFKKSKDAVPFIHELGHIVHDILIDRGYDENFKNEYNNSTTSDDYDEYFVNCFLGYLMENMNDEQLSIELAMDSHIKTNEYISSVLDTVFNPNKEDISGKTLEIRNYLNAFEDLVKNN